MIGQLARAAVASSEPELRVDVLARRADPRPLLTPVVRRSLVRYADWFPRLLQSHGVSPAAVAGAAMCVAFDLSRAATPGVTGTHRLAFRCVVRITDDRGRVHEGTVDGAWTVRLDNAPIPRLP